MNKILKISIICILFCSCFGPRINSESKNCELIKQLAYCKCLEYNIANFVGKDTLDRSIPLINQRMDIYGGYFVNHFYPIIDSISKDVYKQELNAKGDTNFTAESSCGKVDYKSACLDFYKSKKLDSLAKNIYKESIRAQ